MLPLLLLLLGAGKISFLFVVLVADDAADDDDEAVEDVVDEEAVEYVGECSELDADAEDCEDDMGEKELDAEVVTSSVAYLTMGFDARMVCCCCCCCCSEAYSSAAM